MLERKHGNWVVWEVLLIALFLLFGRTGQNVVYADITFFVTGDPQYWTGNQPERNDNGVLIPLPGKTQAECENDNFGSCETFIPNDNEASITQRAVIAEMNRTPGIMDFFTGMPIPEPHGVLVAGDLTQDGIDGLELDPLNPLLEFIRLEVAEDFLRDQVSLFESQWGLTGDDGELEFPVFDGYGNHDNDPDTTSDLLVRALHCTCPNSYVACHTCDFFILTPLAYATCLIGFSCLKDVVHAKGLVRPRPAQPRPVDAEAGQLLPSGGRSGRGPQ